MKFKDVQDILKQNGIKFKSPKEWVINIKQKDRTPDTIQMFLKACRNVDICNWHIKFPDNDKDPIQAWWN